MKKENKTIGVKLICAWIFSVMCIIVGIAYLFTSFLSGIFYFLAGLIILPPFNVWLKKKHKLEITTWLKVIIFFVLLTFAGMSLSDEDAEKANQDTENLLGIENALNIPQTQDTPTTSDSKTWHDVISLSGNGNQDTSSFYIKGNKAKIIATTCCGHPEVGSYSFVDLKKENGEYIIGAGLSISTDGSEEGYSETTYRNLDAGEYYINVITGLGWEVEVEEYY